MARPFFGTGLNVTKFQNYSFQIFVTRNRCSVKSHGLASDLRKIKYIVLTKLWIFDFKGGECIHGHHDFGAFNFYRTYRLRNNFDKI